MSKLLKKLEGFGFKKSCSIIKGKKNHPIFEGLNNESDTGIVYVWVANNPPEVLYIGSTSLRLKDRCNSHIGGFKGNSAKGLELKKKLNEIFKANKSVDVFSKKSDGVSFFGKKVSSQESEERALLEIYNKDGKLWNFSKKGKSK
jgi:hypothetical protein